MFLVRLKTMGNCCITDLDDFMLYSGNDQIVDLEQYFDPELIKKSCMEGGNLFDLINANIIEKVNPDHMDYKKQVRQSKKQELQNQNIANRKTIAETIATLKQMEVQDCLEMLEHEYFDNYSVLQRLMDDKTCTPLVRKTAKQLMHDALNKSLDQKFSLI